jgi:hypothetical protein
MRSREFLNSFPPPAADPQRMKRQSFSDVTRLLPILFSSYQSLHKFTHKHSSNDLQGGAA